MRLVPRRTGAIVPCVTSLSFFPRAAHAALPLIATLGLLAGCGDEEPEVTTPSSLRNVEVKAVSPRNVRITWEAMAEAEIVISRKGPGGGYEEVARKDGDHGRFLDLGLEPEASYRYRLAVCRADGCEDPYQTSSVATPESFFPSVEVTVPATATDDDFVVFGTYRLAAELYKEGHMAAVDRSGRIMWEYATYEWGPITEVQPLPDGTIATGQYMYLVQIDLDGTELYRWTETTAKHDIDRLPDGRWGFLFFDPFETEPGYTMLGDGVILLNQEGTAVEWEWRARDHIPLTDVNEQDLKDQEMGLGHDWTHGNAITFNDEGTKVLVNIRNLDRIYQIDVATGETDWIMGEGGDFGAGLWSHCHDPQFLDDNRVLMFDNGLRRKPEYSRVIEVEFDPEAKTAEIVWEYRETPDFYSFALGSAQLQDSGNILVADGINGRLLEVTRDKQKVWELLIEKYYWTYKAVSMPRSVFTEW